MTDKRCLSCHFVATLVLLCFTKLVSGSFWPYRNSCESSLPTGTNIFNVDAANVNAKFVAQNMFWV